MSKNISFYFLLIIACSGYLGLIFLPFFLLYGAINGIYSKKIFLKDRKHIVFLFILFFLIPFIKSNSNVLLFDFCLNTFILFTSILISQFFFFKRGVDKFKITISLNIFFILYLIICSFLGISLIDSVKLIFPKSSYHIVFWILFIFNSICLIDLSHYKLIYKNKKKVFFLTLSFFVVSLILGGRSGILISALIFLYTIYLLYKKYFFLTLIGFFALSFFINYISFFELALYEVSTDLYERRLQFSARQLIWDCYLENLQFEDYMFGFNKFDAAGSCLYYLDRFDGYSHHIMTESSFLSLISYTGILGFVYIVFLTIRAIMYSRNYKFHAIITICLIFRVSSADYLFFTIYDWFFLILVFNYNDQRFNNSFSGKNIQK